jgi:hypothetical protein
VSTVKEAREKAIAELELDRLETHGTEFAVAAIDALIAAVYADASREQDEKDSCAGLIHQVASPLAETEPRPDRLMISYELEGRCLWHLECQTNPLRCSPMRVVASEPERSVVECVSCGERGYYPVGGLGRICCEKVGSGPPPAPAERAETTRRSEAPSIESGEKMNKSQRGDHG